MADKIVFTPNIVLNGGINQQGSQTEINDNQWIDALNVEPLPDGFRSRSGYTNENALVLPTVDQSFELGTDSRIMLNGTAERIAQGFQIPATANVVAVEVRMKKGSGTPSVVINCSIHTDSSGPSTVVTGLDTSDFSSVAAADLQSDYRWFRFAVPAAVSLTLSTQYYLMISQTNASANEEAILEEDTTPSQYANGSVYIAADTGSFTNVPDADLNFRVLTDATPAWITGIHDYSLSDATTERHLVFAGQYLYKNVAGTLTSVTDKVPVVAHEFTQSQNTFPSMVTANDRVLIAHGTDAVSKKFYIHSGTEYWENEGIAQPTDTPTPSNSGTTDVPAAGDYEFDYYYWNSDIGIASERRYNGTDALAHTANGTNNILLSGLPGAVVRLGDRATHIRIEVKGPSDLFFRLLKEIAIGTTTYSFTATDFAARSTEAEYDDQVPPQHSIKQVAENRQYIAGNTTYPWRLYFSKVSDGVGYHESIPSGNFRDFGKGDGDYITALGFMSPRILIVGFKNSIWALDARSPKTSDRQKISNGIGIANHKAFVVIGGVLFFVSDSDKHKGMFAWTIGEDEPKHLAGIDDTFQSLLVSRLDQASCIYYAPDDNRHQWWTSVTKSSISTANDTILVYDHMLNSWTIYNIPANILGQVEESSIIEPFIGNQGYEAKADDGTTDNGTAISSTLDTKHYDFGATGQKKKLRFVDYIARKIDTSAVTVTVVSDFGKGSGTSLSLDYPTTGTGFTLGTDTLGSATAFMGGALEDSAEREAARAVGRFLGFKFGSQAEFYFKSVSFGLQGTGRR